MKAFISGRPYWWQWYTILSCDAVLVVLAWQAMLARAFGARLSWERVFILGASTWLAYTADRWIEGWRLPLERVRTQRHYFAVRWRWPLFIAWVAVLAADVTLALRSLHAHELRAGLLLLIPVLLYLLSHQFLHRNHPWRLPKEIVVALLLMAGVSVFVIGDPRHLRANEGTLLVSVTLLFLINCVLISVWEREVDTTHGQVSLAHQLRRIERLAHLLPWALMGFSLVAAWQSTEWLRAALVCASASAALLGVLHPLQPRLGRQLSRVLADVVLLTPFIPLALL